MQKYMVKSLASQKRCLHKNFKIFYNFVLSGKLLKLPWTYLSLNIAFFGKGFLPRIKSFFTHI